MAADGFGCVDDWFEAAVCRPVVPLVEIFLGKVGGLFVVVLECKPDPVGTGSREVGSAPVEAVELLPLLSGEVFGVLEPDLAGPGIFG